MSTPTLFHAITDHGNGWWFTGTRIVKVTELLVEGGCRGLVVADIPAIDDEAARAYDPDHISNRVDFVPTVGLSPAYPIELPQGTMMHTWDQETASRFRSFRDTYRRAEGIPRAILHTGEVQANDWPNGAYVQGGTSGVVFKRSWGSYRTAFVEAMLPDSDSGERGPFIRGEGETVAVAEDAAWAKWQEVDACPGHEWEQRGYRNGGGICKHCSRFGMNVFDVKVVGHPCTDCGVGTNHFCDDDDNWFCEEHFGPHQPHCAHGQPQPSKTWAKYCDCDEEAARHTTSP
ncbi:hypothetical protein [Ornithinimicrobium murale]|uniref:hypothetical protein n=1 Tax=Ornithinimicrobium murale TaxID=1050153 RepID=UPI000E0D63AB|nr:hypothetical protein [Ornithinimicrobium murale]